MGLVRLICPIGLISLWGRCVSVGGGCFGGGGLAGGRLLSRGGCRRCSGFILRGLVLLLRVSFAPDDLAIGSDFHLGHLGGFGSGPAKAEERGHFLLHAGDFIQPQLGIAHDVNLAGLLVFVDQHDALFGLLAILGGEHALALQHRGEDVAGVFRVGIAFLNQALEHGEGILARSDLGLAVGRGLLIDGLPEGEGLAVGDLLFPGIQADVAPGIFTGFGIKIDGGIVLLAVLERAFGYGTMMGAGADVPLL